MTSNGWNSWISGVVDSGHETTKKRKAKNMPELTAPAVEKQFYSLGFLAARFQRSVPSLREILSAAGISPCHCTNDLPLYDGFAMIAIANALREGAGHE